MLPSPIIHLMHIPKTAGNSIWRDLIKQCELVSANPDHIIKLDTRHVADISYWNKLYRNNKINEFENNTVIYPQLSLAILANKEINSEITKYKTSHKILIHHHNSGVLRIPLDIKSKSKNDQETSSHKWETGASPDIYIFTIRDPVERTISHIQHSFRENSLYGQVLKEDSLGKRGRAIWNAGLDADFLPIDRRPAIDALSEKNNEEETTDKKKNIQWVLQLLPELATYQMRYILTFICSSNPSQTMDLLWGKSNQDIIKIWDRNFNLIVKKKVACIYLDRSKSFHISPRFESFLNEKYNVSNFYPSQFFKETSTNKSEKLTDIELSKDFINYSNHERDCLYELFDLSI